MKVCFIGHRHISITENLVLQLRATISDLIDNGATTFLFGSMSEFDTLAWEIVTEYKALHPNIARIYVRASFEHIDKSYEQYLLMSYEETYFPKQISKAGKYAYVERNYEMINNSSFCVFYYDRNYTPTSKTYGHKIPKTTGKSGTKIAYEYAVKKKKNITNLFVE